MTAMQANSRAVHIGAVSASFVDSRIAMPQWLGCGMPIDYLVFDCLAEGVMSILARARKAGQPAYVSDFVDAQMAPYLPELAERGIKVVANAGGLDPEACAAALREAANQAGVSLKIASISGDDLSGRADELVTHATRDMFDDIDLRTELDGADQLLSLTAYTGAFPIAAALAAGADIVVTGRAVDSAATLGPLIHEFGWVEDDFDLLSAGTLAGHLIECTTQVCGATFTDWRDVPDWANIGFPVAICQADGSIELTKPNGTGGLISRGTVAEQMLYEVSDPAAYVVPDAVCDWTGVRLEETGPNRVRISGTRGTGRPEMLKAALTWDRGFRATAMAPIIGHEAAAKAERTASELFKRCDWLADERGLGPYSLHHVDVVGGAGPGASAAICRMIADHPTMAGAGLFAREQSSIMTSMAVGTSVPLGTTVRPLTRFASFLLPRATVSLSTDFGDGPQPAAMAQEGTSRSIGRAAEPPRPESEAVDTVPLVALAFARSGDKGNLFNVGVIARESEYLPFLFAALTPQRVAAHYAPVLGRDAAAIGVARYPVPGIDALNLVIGDAMGGGMLSHPGLDPAAKSMAQMLLDFPVPVSAEIRDRIQEATGR